MSVLRSSSSSATHSKPLIGRCSLSGLGSDFNINADHSGAAANYDYSSQDGDVLITKVRIHIFDATGAPASNLFGNVAARTNGLIFRHMRGSTVVSTLTPDPIKQLSDWGRYTNEITTINPTAAAALHYTCVDWTLPADGILLKNDEADVFRVVANDDFSGIDILTVYVLGYHGGNAAVVL